MVISLVPKSDAGKVVEFGGTFAGAFTGAFTGASKGAFEGVFEALGITGGKLHWRVEAVASVCANGAGLRGMYCKPRAPPPGVAALYRQRSRKQARVAAFVNGHSINVPLALPSVAVGVLLPLFVPTVSLPLSAFETVCDGICSCSCSGFTAARLALQLLLVLAVDDLGMAFEPFQLRLASRATRMSTPWGGTQLLPT